MVDENLVVEIIAHKDQSLVNSLCHCNRLLTHFCLPNALDKVLLLAQACAQLGLLQHCAKTCNELSSPADQQELACVHSCPCP